MLTFSERIEAVEALLATITYKYSNELRTDDELDAAITELWDRIYAIKARVKNLQDTLNITRENLSTANGS